MRIHTHIRAGYSSYGYIVVALGILITGSGTAMPPHPSLLEQNGTANRTSCFTLPYETRPEGLCSPDDFFSSFLKKEADRRSADASLAPTAGPFKILGLLVDFSDHVSSVSATFFDSLIFDSAGSTVWDYFDDISYGQLDIVTVSLPSTIGWTRAPQTYAYYVDGQRGTGTYPTNSQGLVEDLVNLVDGSVDFSQYDNDLDGDVDVLLVVHSGTGAELSGQDTDIHSHKWSLPWPGVTKDGVRVYSYTIQPEFWDSPGDMTTGVYAHELCHGFGLPDLYDTDYSSNGIGDWGIMSFGSWNGPNNRGGSPAHPSAWSRAEMGFGNVVTVAYNTTNQAITPVQTGGTIFRLPAVGGVAGEYFLLENRQQSGYDSYLPHDGLLIWHVDSGKADNTGEWWPGQPVTTHYKVALEQADGLWDLEHSDIYGNTGDMGDPFPGSSATTSFSAGSTPSSDSYTGGSSVTAVTNINEVGQTIFADLFMGVAAGVDDPGNGGLPQQAELSQNYPNPFNPSTNIEFWLQSGAEVELSVFNLLGRRVSTLVDQYIDAGQMVVEWDALDDHGKPVASGIYFYTLKVDDLALTKKMMLVR